MKRKNLLLSFLVILLFSSTTFAQGLVRGIIQDVNTNETLIGATVVIKGSTIGVTSNLDGSFLLIAPEGDLTLIFRYVGYEEQTKDVTVKDGSTYDVGNILMRSSAIGLNEVNVLASVAIDRETPVAVSTISAQTIKNNLGSQEFPEIMNYSPNVFSTKGGGGYGDANLRVRGYDQSNTAVMINGIPVNDMENGWVYWSNWAGLGDATRSIQIQRGLGASKLAISSVGGTINIITKTSDMNKGGSIGFEATDFGRFKTQLSLSTGLLKTGTAVTFVGSRTYGKGYIDATFVDAWSYFLSVSQNIGKKHQLVFTAIGAPQQHGQRDAFYMLDSAKYDKYGAKYNQNWGYLGGEVLNERVNYYHKPQIAANWYYNISDKAFLATSAYVSIGRGGGSGALGISPYKYEPPQTSYGQYNWDKLSDYNHTNIDTANALLTGQYKVAGEDTLYNSESVHIIRNSVNNHMWYGLLSSLNYKFSDNLTLTAGIDSRFYVGEHYREVKNLVGGDYWYDPVFGASQPGDKIAYWNDGIVNYAGLFGQLEYTSGKLAAFVAISLSNTWTKRIDYYSYQTGIITEQYAFDNPNKSETLSNFGYNAKLGLNYNINEKNNVFFNAGTYSRVPFFRFHFLNFNNTINTDLTNENVYAFEVGYGFQSRKFKLNLNGYYSIWDNIAILTTFQTSDGRTVNSFMSDLKEDHYGIELDANYTFNRWITAGAILAVGSWEYANNAQADLYDDQTREFIETATIYTEGLKVPNQPQTQFGLNATFKIAKRIDLGAQWIYYANQYANFTPESRKNPADNSQSWKLPSYGTLNLRAGWAFNIGGLDSFLNINCYNATNTVAIVEAEDRSVNDNGVYTHEFSKGFWVWGRNFNFALTVNF